MTAPVLLHASTVAFAGKGILLTGASGRGKSALALQLMALGADLVADDQTELCLRGGQLIASAPPVLAGVIEARGLGLLRAPHVAEAALCLCVDLDQTEPARLPEPRQITVLGQILPLVLGSPASHFPFALRLYVLHGRHA